MTLKYLSNRERELYERSRLILAENNVGVRFNVIPGDLAFALLINIEGPDDIARVYSTRYDGKTIDMNLLLMSML